MNNVRSALVEIAQCLATAYVNSPRRLEQMFIAVALSHDATNPDLLIDGEGIALIPANAHLLLRDSTTRPITTLATLATENMAGL
jgi:hypothetical protein